MKKSLRESNAVMREVSMEQDDDKVRKIEVSGGNISLVVDFSDNAFESNNESCPKEEDQTHQECLVGNLVWAMTKSKKWWPGEVVGYRADAEESFMVRYLGESHQLESWCAPSKLRPFKESFERVLTHRTDAGFFVAVEEAMTLLGKSLKLEMTCSCMPGRKANRRKTKPLIVSEFSVDRMDPGEFVTQLKDLAICGGSKNGILEGTVMKSRLSAFYSYYGHKEIPMEQLSQQNEVRRKSFNGGKMEESEFVGSASVVGGSSRRKFRREWFRKFVSEVDNVSAREDLVDTSTCDLVSRLKLLAVDSTSWEETENVGLFEWFFSKFRISVFRDENSYGRQLANMAGLEDPGGTELRTYKSKNVGKSKVEPFCGVSVANTEKKTSEKSKIEVSGGVSVAITEKKSLEKSKIEVTVGASVANTEQKISETHKISEKSKMGESSGGVSAANTEQKTCVLNTRAEIYRTYQRAPRPKIAGVKTIKDTIGGHSDFSSSVANSNEPCAKHVQGKQSQNGKACMTTDTLSKSAATLVPDLNSGLASAEPETLVPPPNALPQKVERPFCVMLNFQAAAAAPCSNYGTSGTGFVSSMTDVERKFTSADLCAKVVAPKKRGRKRKNPQELPKVTNGIPDLNGTGKEPAPVQPQAEPTRQRRKRRKKEEMPNRSTTSTRGITILVLKFSSKESMPSKEDLTSTFSSFGPLDASETHVYDEITGAEVAFVSSGDAVEAVKSLDKAKPFGDNLVSFRLQQKLINVYRNIAPKMPVISQVSPLQKPKNAHSPISVESMRQNLLMMTAMLDKSGDHLSRETKAKLKSDISALLEKISSMPSSSSS